MIKVVADFEGEVNGVLVGFVAGDILTEEQSKHLNAIDKGLAKRVNEKKGVKYAES